MADRKTGAKAKRGAAKERTARRKRRLIAECALAAALLLGLVAFLAATSRSGANRDLTVGTAPQNAVTAEPEAPEASPEPEETPLAEPTEGPTPLPTATPSPTPAPTPTPVPTATPRPVKLQYPYALVVDRVGQVVTVYTVGEEGKYSIIARQMICSTDKYGWKPTTGIYKLDGQRKRWMSTLTGSYVQYATRISGTILFHSLPYNKQDPSQLMWREYLNLGKNVSEGCVRLTCEDAKWIYENVPDGTLVWFREGHYDAFTLDGLQPPALVGGKWDPTDDTRGNPDYIGGSYHPEPVATAYPGVTPAPTSYKILTWD